MKNLGAAAFVFATLAFVLPSCQTMAGAGRDLESAGEAIQRKAENP